MTTKPTNADDGGTTTDRAAALAAKLTTFREIHLKGTDGKAKGIRIALNWSEFHQIITALEASRPAQDIVAEMREKVEHEISSAYQYHNLKASQDYYHSGGDCRCLNEVDGMKKALAILSPTKNTAPTEAEES